MKVNRVKVVGVDGDGKEVTVYACRPKASDMSKAQLVAAAAIKSGIESGALMRHQLADYMSKQGLWNDEKQKQSEELDKQITDDLLKLKKGGIKKSEGRDLAVAIKVKRNLKLILEAQKRQLDEYTVEAQADNARFDYLVSVCVKDEEGNSVFSSVDDYKDRAEEDWAIQAASALAGLIYGYDKDWEKELPENKFLIKYKLVDDKLRLVNKENKLVSIGGQLVDENYNLVDEQGRKVNDKGELIGDDGLPLVEEQPFLDDDENPI